LKDYTNNSFSVLANTGTSEVGSVIFEFNGIERYRIESIAPFSLYGDAANGTEFYPVEFQLGTNTITATPYSGKYGTGYAGTPVTINFEVVNQELTFTLI